ncbi:hypothetical protein SEVIR_7G337200v4 [Setaria viridis]|uniref:Saposin B-type domain-containing protein n=2 Tax=Setaria TaxID=4554 RepID=K3Y9T7_SETIT|nr:uncharacterized protein LOC101753602 [Setaria italica]XP_022683645.1 uncharacterized protein LOC101753602 [Setaria italica]XP_034601949.1 uncharacterized protein LOC117862564 [Setaria viridis]XP_034601950.1 uncharacterized protein LOC117862564 [Setaria viridis]RCV36555.1 hypothetical protein SETIT_7G327400v2 [Setaria italica]RCV36556.1 hypothetical protein SETIT_7G327400v2 [Setaria italica]TKW07885.1 hypothetical protein SEVIR_7G337200v2 [Setaria viridis]TKW07886.1 hypothetical protein SE
MGSKAPLFLLLLLLLVASGPARAKDAGYGPVYKEQISSIKIPVHLKSSNPICSACENFTNEAVSYLSKKQTQDKIVEFLHDACSQSFSLEQKCIELMQSYAALLFSKIAEIKPEEFCKQHGMCRDIAHLSGVRSDSTCVFCHHLLDEIMSKLKDPDAEFEIIQILIKECNKIEGHVQQCKRLVLQYIPLILVNGEKFLEKNDVCALVQACPASRKRTAISVEEGVLLSDA